MRFAISSFFGLFITLITSSVAIPVFAQGVPSASSTAPLIFQMADGRFYHPASGTTAASREALLSLIQGPPSASAGTTTIITSLPGASSSGIEVPPTASSLPSSLDNPPLVVQAARRALILLRQDAKPVEILKKKPSDWRSVTLAIWDSQTDALEMVALEKNGTQLRSISQPVSISVRGGAGYDTDYAITPSTKVVVGVRYTGVETITQSKKTVYQKRDIVYVPYSQALHTPEVIRWGKIVLDRLVKNALDDIRAVSAPSKAFPGRLLADVADPVAIKSIMAIEHLDQYSVKRGADDRLDLFYVELGLNEEAAFHQEISSAGASGFLQFIPSTYAAVVKAWPQLKLISDFKKGTADPRNAIKAQIAYLDGVWSDLPSEAKDERVTTQEQRRAYLIAAYNTGGVRVRRAITRWGSAWDQDYRKEWERLDARQTVLGQEIFQLKKKVAAEKKASAKKKLNDQLAVVRASHAKVTAELEAVERSRLKAETLGYLNKYYLIAPRMKVPQIASL